MDASTLLAPKTWLPRGSTCCEPLHYRFRGAFSTHLLFLTDSKCRSSSTQLACRILPSLLVKVRLARHDFGTYYKWSKFGGSICFSELGHGANAVSTEDEPQLDFSDQASQPSVDSTICEPEEKANGHTKNLNGSVSTGEDQRSRLEGSLSAAVVEAAEKVAEVASSGIEAVAEVASSGIEAVAEVASSGIEAVAERVEVAAQTMSTVGEIEPISTIEHYAMDKSSAVKTVAFWVSAATIFGAVIAYTEGFSKASEFFAGYILEQSLSVDNLFVFVLIFNYFKVPVVYQNRVLTYGIAGAIVFRATMISLGIASLERFEALNLGFAAILLFSSYKLFNDTEEEEEDLSNNFIVSLCRRFIPVSPSYDGNNFFTTTNGARKATPLLLALVVVELSDVVFAVDSIPAVFGVTRDSFIVLSSNLFAILGLRSLYTLISGSLAELEYLQPAIAIVLGFIGSKMVLEYFGVHVPTETSLAVVGAVLGTGVAISLRKGSEEEK